MVTTEEARIAEIRAKLGDPIEPLTVPWQNGRKTVSVINISLDSVLLNPRSHRIRSQIESLPEARAIAEDPFSSYVQDLIEGILKETPGYHNLLENLRTHGQSDAGIITHAGVLVNANTRAVALRELGEEYIRVGVLPESATEKEIIELEARLQLSRDFKQEYSLTNELLFIKEQIDAGEPKEDLALLLGRAQSRNRAHLRKGVEEIEQSLRILLHIRELQHAGGGRPPLTFFDVHQSALEEADRAYMAARERDLEEATRVRNGRMLGILTGVRYRDLRSWDSDDFLERYLEPQFESGDLAAITCSESRSDSVRGLDDGLSIFDQDATVAADGTPVNLDALLNVVARTYGEGPDSEVAPGLTRETVVENIAAKISQAADEKQMDQRDEKRATAPVTLIRDARARVIRAGEALSAARTEREFNSGQVRYELRRLSQEIDQVLESLDSGE